jgi:hypothetical protein
VLPFSTILSIFDQNSYPPFGGFSATAKYPQVGQFCFVDRKLVSLKASLRRKFIG